MPVESTKIGDILQSRAQTLVNTVNCVGVMGKGIALQFKKRFPKMYEDYERKCEQGAVKLGRPYLFTSVRTPWVLNFPTKDHWRSVSKLPDIVEGLKHLQDHYKEWGIKSLAVPPLGCGNGQLDWDIVGPTLYRYLNSLDIPVEMFAPHGTPGEQLKFDFLADGPKPDRSDFKPQSRIEPADVALAAIVSRIGREPYHWPVGRIRLQKIAYFATEVGLPTGLEFERGNYGPFSKELKKRIAKLVNNGLLVEHLQGRMIVVTPGPTYGDARESNKPLLKQWIERIERVADLILRLPTNDEAELAATVHFVYVELKEQKRSGSRSISECEIAHRVAEWKPQMAREQIAKSVRNLNLLEWISAEASDAGSFVELNEAVF